MLIKFLLHDLIPYRLVKIDGELVEHYNRALDILIGKTTERSSFTVDKRGASPELEQELGANYLQNSPSHRYMIIVTPYQGEADLIYDEFSFDEQLVDYVFRNYLSVINAVTRVDSLYGEMDDGVMHFSGIEDTVLIRRLQVALDTPSPFLEKARQLQSLTEQLRENAGLLVADDSAVPKSILALVHEVGDIRSYNFMAMDVNWDVESYYSRLFGGVHVFRSLPGVQFKVMHLPVAGDYQEYLFKTQKRCQTMIIYDSDEKPADGPDVVYLHHEDKANIIEFLVQNQFAGFDETLVSRRIAEMEDFALAEQGGNPALLSDAQRHQALAKKPEMPALFEGLLKIQRDIGSGYRFFRLVQDLDPQIQALLLRPQDTHGVPVDVVGNLLCRWWPYDCSAMLAYDRLGLARHFAHAKESIKSFVQSQCEKLGYSAS